MALTYTQLLRPLIFEFNAETLTYTAEMTFSVEVTDMITEVAAIGEAAWSEAAWSTPTVDNAPAYVEIVHHGRYMYGGTIERTVRCYQCGRRVDTTEGDAASRKALTIMYAGRVSGTHGFTPRVQMVSETLYHNLHLVGEETTYRPIGVGDQGVTIDIPMLVVDVVECTESYASV